MDNEIKRIQLKFTIVWKIDYDYLIQWVWYCNKISKVYYAVRSQRVSKFISKKIGIHTLIMERMNLIGEMIDHIDCDGLNNCRDNLRICNNKQNAHNVGINKVNTVGYKGVHYIDKTRKFRAKIRINNERIHLGNFINATDAARAYDLAAIYYHKEFANLNFLYLVMHSKRPEVIGRIMNKF